MEMQYCCVLFTAIGENLVGIRRKNCRFHRKVTSKIKQVYMVVLINRQIHKYEKCAWLFEKSVTESLLEKMI